MKLKLLILAFPVLCLACNNASTPQDPASNTEANPIVAKEVVGVHELTTDYNYAEPCNVLGEEYVRGQFNVAETGGLEETLAQNGCEFKWGANRILLTFAGRKPFQSIYMAEYTFNTTYQNKAVNTIEEPVDVVDTETVNGPETQGTGAERPTPSNAPEEPMMADKHPDHAGVSAPVPPVTPPAVDAGSFEAVPELGDKAVWNTKTKALHVLYNNHIINVVVDTQDKPEIQKEHAKNLAEVIMDKLAQFEFTSRF